jgi:hypothetical protein
MASTLATAAWAFILAVRTGSSDVVFRHVLAGRGDFSCFFGVGEVI